MFKLNKDVLFLIFKELQDDNNSLYSCLLVNKTWCEIIIPILWKNPLIYLVKDEQIDSQFNIIISHLSNETRRNLDSQGIKLPTVQQKPLFNYISFCKYLALGTLEQRIFNIKNIEYSKLSIVANEVLKLFINRNMKVTLLCIPARFNYQIHLIPGAEDCFSELKFLYCNISDDNQNILEGLAKIIKTIKILECNVIKPSSSGISRLIEAQKSLNDVRFIHHMSIKDKFCETLEESLIKHADTIQHLKLNRKPTTKIFQYFVNLISLDVNLHPFQFDYATTNWNYLVNVSLPFLKILKAELVPSKILANLIENTKGQLTEISISYGVADNIIIIQAIHQNCPNLKYFKLLFNNDIILELERLLINCQHLNGLVITTSDYEDKVIDWDRLFEMLVNSSPSSLFMFKFKVAFLITIRLESLKLFFDNWKGSQPMLLHIIIDGWVPDNTNVDNYFELFEKYKAKGIIQKYICDSEYWKKKTYFEDFEWIQEKTFIVDT